MLFFLIGIHQLLFQSNSFFQKKINIFLACLIYTRKWNFLTRCDSLIQFVQLNFYPKTFPSSTWVSRNNLTHFLKRFYYMWRGDSYRNMNRQNLIFFFLPTVKWYSLFFLLLPYVQTKETFSILLIVWIILLCETF